MRKRAIHAYIVDSGTLFSTHQSLIDMVVARHRSTWPRLIALLCSGVMFVIASYLRSDDDDCDA